MFQVAQLVELLPLKRMDPSSNLRSVSRFASFPMMSKNTSAEL